jgi:hypothetical protein
VRSPTGGCEDAPMETKGSRPVGLALLAAAGAALFVAALFLPFQVRPGEDPRILDLDQGFRVWGSLALGPLGVLIAAAAGGWLLLGRWSPRRAAGMIVAAGLWGTLRGAAVVGLSWFPAGAAGDAVDPGVGAYLALAGGVLVLVAGAAAFARAPVEDGARSRAVCVLVLVSAIGYALSNLVSAARLAPPEFEPTEIAVVNLSSPDVTLLWEGLLPGVITIVLLLSAMRILTGTAGGTGALLMGLGLITALQFAGILAWASSGAVRFLSPTWGVALGMVTGVVVFVTGLLSPPGPEPSPSPVPEPA